MTQKLLQSATLLADTLAAENRALAGLDFAHAVALLDAKLRATDAFVAARAHAASAPDELRNRRHLVEDVATRLRELAAENKRLLERAVIVQGRVIGAIVRAVPKATGGVPRYGAGGALAETTRMRPMALSARA
jgi:hypothetical protein